MRPSSLAARDESLGRDIASRLADSHVMEETLAAFVRANTAVGAAALAPEVRLHIATDARGIFEAAERLSRTPDTCFPPYWAFAWPGGQAMARYLLDNPELVAGRRVVDIGAGSGIGAIAAVLAGAAQVLVSDIDPMAEVAIRMNAALNRVADRIITTTRDILGDTPEADLVMISDLVYEPELALRVDAFLEHMANRGRDVLMGDRASGRRPARRLQEIARYAAPLVPPLIENDDEQGRVWRVNAAPARRRRQAGKSEAPA